MALPPDIGVLISSGDPFPSKNWTGHRSFHSGRTVGRLLETCLRVL